MALRHFALPLLAASFVLPVGAQDSPKGGQEKVAFEKSVVPFKGIVTCDRLNYRLKCDSTGMIAGVLAEGSEITVIADQGDFFRILPPKGSHVWISSRNVKKDGDATGLVIVNDAPVRLDSRANAEKVVSLNEGAKVSILKEHMGWMQIAPPDSIGYFVKSKHVKNAGPADVVIPAKTEVGTLKPATKGDDVAVAQMKEAEGLVDEQHKLLNSNELGSVSFDRVIELFTAAQEAATSAEVRKAAEAGARKYRDFAATVALTKLRLDEIRKVREAGEKKEAPVRWDFTGYVDTVGPLWNRPGTHKLVMAGRVVCFLKAKEGDEAMRVRLNQNYEKYVGVRGTITRDPEGWVGYSVIEVDSVDTITER